MALAIGGEIELERILELIVKRGRALVNARSLVIMLREDEDLVVHASAGHAEDMHGARLPIAGSTSGQVLERRTAERITDVSSRLRIAPREFGVEDAHTALLVPMVYRGEALGVLARLQPWHQRRAVAVLHPARQASHAYGTGAGGRAGGSRHGSTCPLAL